MYKLGTRCFRLRSVRLPLGLTRHFIPNNLGRPSFGTCSPSCWSLLVVNLFLNNPAVTPAGPYCPGPQSISYASQEPVLPSGDNINVYWEQQNSIQSFSGGGTLLGSIPINYGCTTCPTIMGIMVESHLCVRWGHLMMNRMNLPWWGSGLWIYVNNFQFNPSVGGSGVNSSIGSAQGCTWSLAAASSAVATLLANGTDCAGNIFAAGPGTNIQDVCFGFVVAGY